MGNHLHADSSVPFAFILPEYVYERHQSLLPAVLIIASALAVIVKVIQTLA